MNHAKLLRFTLVVSLLAILMPFAAFAQSSNGSISGTVTDANGAALPGVTVSATNTATRVTRTVTSNGVRSLRDRAAAARQLQREGGALGISVSRRDAEHQRRHRRDVRREAEAGRC